MRLNKLTEDDWLWTQTNNKQWKEQEEDAKEKEEILIRQ